MKYKRTASASFALAFCALAIALPVGVFADAGVDTDETSEAVVADFCGASSKMLGQLQIEAVQSGVNVNNAAEFTAALATKAGSIKLQDDIELDSIATIESSVVIDLNGHKLTGKSSASKGNRVLVVKSGTTVLQDTVGGGALVADTAAHSDSAIAVEGADSIFILESGKIETRTDKGIYGIYPSNGGSTIINGGEITTTYAALSGNNTTGRSDFCINDGTLTSLYYPAVYMPSQLYLTVNGGTLNGGLLLRMGTVALNGGTINNTATSVSSPLHGADGLDKNSGGMGAILDGITIAAGTYANSTIGNTLNLTIADGVTINSAAGDAVAIYDMGRSGYAQTVNVDIAGGEFKNSTDKKSYVVYSYDSDEAKAMTAGYGSGYNQDTDTINTTIKGGTYATAPELSYVAEGKDVYDLGENGPYVVDDVTTVKMPEEAAYLKIGETIDLNDYLTDVAKKYSTFTVAPEGVVTIDGQTNVLTAATAGKATVNFELHNSAKTQGSFDTVVYTTGAEDQANEDDSAEEGENEKALTNVASEVVDTILGNSSTYANASVANPVDLTLADGTKAKITASADEIKNALANGEEVFARLQVSEFVDDQLTDAENALIEGAMSENAKKFGTVNYRIALETSTTMLGTIIELPESEMMLITFDVSAEPEIADGYRRVYEVIRLHENEAPAVLAATYDSEGKTVSFVSNKFSSFTLAYYEVAVPAADTDTDTEGEATAETPETGVYTGSETSVSEANVAAIVIALVAIAAVVAGAVKFAKR